MNHLSTIAVSDFKLIFRDPSLRIFLAVPLLIFGIVLWVLPAIIAEYPNVQPYRILVLAGAMVQTSVMFGFIYSMVLIDEKDKGVAVVYGILPVAKSTFVMSRLIPSTLFSTLVTYLLLAGQPFYTLTPISCLALALLSGIITPLLSLSVTILSKNKMEGMTWFKLLNLAIALPLVVLILPKIAIWFAWIPTHWCYQTLVGAIEGHILTSSLLMAVVYEILLLIFLVNRFVQIHFR